MTTHVNFGGNVTWRTRRYRPRNERDVLEILARHAGERIRALGAGHSWSEVAAGSDVSLDMRHFRQVEVKSNGLVRVGAGCRLQRLLDKLHAGGDHTLPTLGAVKRQTIAGAIATGTHGSGRQSLSHFVAAVRLAAYDAAGKPQIFEHRGGDELRAARCALGCMGIVLSVDLRTEPKYLVEETLVRSAELGDIGARYAAYPLTQFLLVPFEWQYIFYERKPVAVRRRSLRERAVALLLRLYNRGWIDCVAHALLKLALLAGERAVRRFLRIAARRTLTGIARIDHAEHVLTLGHHYFRHEEMELFVPQARLKPAIDLLRHATEVFAGAERTLTGDVLYGELAAARGSYTHHYPFAFRRVLAEDTLISMACDGGPWISISVFTYHPPRKRAAYYAYCSWLARAMHALFEARLHWGKHFPLDAAYSERAYPRLETFRQLCRAAEFRNPFTERALGFRRAH